MSEILKTAIIFAAAGLIMVGWLEIKHRVQEEENEETDDDPSDGTEQR